MSILLLKNPNKCERSCSRFSSRKKLYMLAIIEHVSFFARNHRESILDLLFGILEQEQCSCFRILRPMLVWESWARLIMLLFVILKQVSPCSIFSIKGTLAQDCHTSVKFLLNRFWAVDMANTFAQESQVRPMHVLARTPWARMT